MAMRPTLPRSHEEAVYRYAAGQIDSPSRTAWQPLIGASWRRCVERYHLDPGQPQKPQILTATELREQREPIDGFAYLSRDEISRLFDQVHGAGLVVLLANTRGVTIEYRGDPRVEPDLKASGLYLGSVWAEELEGTNGVGTCLATGRPLTVFRDEHFRTRNTALTCTVAPIHDPFGRAMAVLDVSSMGPTTRESQHLALQLVAQSARRLERANIYRQFQRCWKLRLRGRGADGRLIDLLLVADDRERVIAADGAAFAAGLVPDGAGLIGARLDAVLAEPPELPQAVRQIAASGQDLAIRLAHDGSQVALRVRPPEPPSVRGIRSASPGRGVRRGAGDRLTLDELGEEETGLQAQLARLRRVMDHPIPILLQGETGTGKEAFARAIHDGGPHAAGPFVAVNCAAIPESLIESELFGYQAGAFTGARRQGMPGRILQANGGTLFLDEIGDMPLELQTRVLRVLAESEILPLGGGDARRVDFRLVCATHQDLGALVRAGRFREDLYYRVRGFVLQLPAVRERSDKRALIRRALAQEAEIAGDTAAIEPQALACLAAYDWPGNIRELRSELRVALALAASAPIRAEHLSAYLRDEATTLPAEGGTCAAEAPATSERDRLVDALSAEAWCVTRAALRLGISRATLHRRIRHYDIVAPNKRRRAP